jgi:hypothetical protein
MNIYEKMNELVNYNENTVVPFLKEVDRDTWFYLYTEDELDDFHYDISNYRMPFEHAEDDLLAMCKSSAEKELVDTFYLEIILPIINEIDRIDRLIDEQ